MDSPDKTMWAILYMFFFVVAVGCFVRTTLTDHYLPPPPDQDHSRYCRFCQKRVPSYAKHCRMCNRCRVGFDHHCKYVNNCVTTDNYYSFYFGTLLLIVACLIAMIQNSICIYLYVKDPTLIKSRLTNYLHRNVNDVAMKVLFAFSYVFNLIMSCPLCVLVGYHIFFQARMITTYDYLMNNVNANQMRRERFFCTCGVNKINPTF